MHPSIENYLSTLSAERKDAMHQLRDTIQNNLPKGFVETFQYGMISYVVPHTIYPNGYHCKPTDPLPFISIASQKNAITFYHMGMYAVPELLDWFVAAYPNHVATKLDMGKSCVRFKKPELIPFELIAELVKKMKPKDWIKVYESQLKR
jgi:hypothetical protein